MRKIIILITIALYISSCSCSEEKITTPVKPVFDKQRALEMSWDFVSKQLKSPSTANYGGTGEENVTRYNDTTFIFYCKRLCRFRKFLRCNVKK